MFWKNVKIFVTAGVLWSGCVITWVGYVTNWQVTPETWLGGAGCKIWYYSYYV